MFGAQDGHVFGNPVPSAYHAALPEADRSMLAMRIGERVIYPASFPSTQRRLETAGVDVTIVDVSELQKAEGAVTCCSLIFDVS